MSTQSVVKVMSYLFVLLTIFSQATAYANEFNEVISLNKGSSPTVMELTADEKKWLAQHKNIRIAYDGSLTPYSFVNDQGKIDGIAVEIMGILSHRLGINFEVYPNYDWSSVYKAGAKRKVDMVATMVNRTDRAEWFSFTKPYLTKSLVIVTKKDNNSIANRNDLAGKKIAVVKGYQYGEQVAKEFPDAKRVKVETLLDSLKAVDQGQVDAAILFLGTANYLQSKKQLNNLRIAAFYERNSANESIAVRKDWPILVRILQKGLDSLTEEEVQTVFAKWVVQGGVVPATELTPLKPQPPAQPIARSVVEIEQLPGAFNAPKTPVEATPKPVETTGGTNILMLLAAAFFVFLMSYRKFKKRYRRHKKRQLKSKNGEMMAAATRNLQAITEESKTLTSQAETAVSVDQAAPMPEPKVHVLTSETIARLGLDPTQTEFPADKAIHYQRDSEGRFTYVSASVSNVLGYSELDFKTNYRLYLTENPLNNRLDDDVEVCMQGQPCQPYKVEMYDAGQGIHLLEFRDSPIYDGRGHCIGIEGIMQDITVQKQDEDWPELPELPVGGGVQSLQTTLQQAIRVANANQKSVALIYMSLDRMRFLDDSLVSDSEIEVLNEAGKRLRSTLRDSDTVVQLNLSNFALILPETDAHAVNLIIEKIRKILQVPYLVGVHSIVLDVNIGSAVYPTQGTDPHKLISKAKTYSPLSTTSNPKAALDDDVQAQEDSLQLQQDLVFALDECNVILRASSPHNINALSRHSQFSVYYQSRHNREDYSIAGFEALIRWHHPQLGLLLPRVFVSLVKEIGLLDIMTYWIIQQASFQAMAWEKQGVRPGLIAINLGELGMKRAVEVNKIIAIIEETGAKPEWLSFSVPESEITKNPDVVIPIINELAAAGLVVAIDNFGSDKALLSLLKTIPAQIVEIDPAFIFNLSANDSNADVIADSVAMLHGLGKTVIAKAVESEEQLEFLTTSGCDMIQGHLLSRPLPPHEAKKLIEKLPEFAWYFQKK